MQIHYAFSKELANGQPILISPTCNMTAISTVFVYSSTELEDENGP